MNITNGVPSGLPGDPFEFSVRDRDRLIRASILDELAAQAYILRHPEYMDRWRHAKEFAEGVNCGRTTPTAFLRNGTCFKCKVGV